MIDQLAFLWENFANLLIGFPGQRPGGLLLSLILAFFGVGVGFVVALIVGSGRGARLPAVRLFSRIYIEIFRGIPLLLLLLLVYQVIGSQRFGLDLSAPIAAAISLILYSSAYQAEIVHSGLEAVPAQITESARSVGASAMQGFFFIKLRYALRVMLPAFVGQGISLFKDTSVVVIIAVADLMTVARDLLGSDVKNLVFWVPLYLFVGFIYFCVAFGFSRLANRWEKATKTKDLVQSLANY